MFAKTCPSLEELQDFATGRLPDDTSDHLADHLDRCAECQATIATLDDADDTFVTALKQPLAKDPVVEELQCEAAIARAAAFPSAPAAERSREDHTTLSHVGDKLGEYVLLDEIGRGGMGRVYRALQTKLDRVVALKVLPSHRSEDRRAIARFEREMKAIGRLDHANIVHAYDAREIDGKPVLVMEYVEGCDLAAVLRNLGSVKTADACELVRQAALGLQYAHENGLVHRDIKPSNVMLTPTGKVKLLDLGLARFEQPLSPDDEMTGAGQPMGSVDYIAPEQVTDSRAADIRADIYSLGCTLFKLITGYAPFSRSHSRGTFDKLTAHVNHPAPSIQDCGPSLPDDLAKLIDKMLAKSPDDRPATPADVAAALNPHCSGSDLAGLESIAAEAERQRSSYQKSAFGPPPQYAAPPLKGDPQPTLARWPGWLWGFIVALVSLAGIGGFALGVIITIERNGKETTVEVPDGSNVKVDPTGAVNVKLPPDSKSTDTDILTDDQGIQGVWKIVDRKGKSRSQSLLRAGRTINPDGTYSSKWKTSRIEISEQRVRIIGEHELPISHEYQINPSESPKMIDLFVGGEELLGVYELDGQQLKICVDWSGHRTEQPNVRPQAVWAGLHSDQEMLVLERVGSVIPHSDQTAILGSWVFESASLRMNEADPNHRRFASPMGVIEPGREVIITPDEFIIKGLPADQLPPRAKTPAQSQGYMYAQWQPPWLHPSSENDPYAYALDETRSWIGFSTSYNIPCPGIYGLDGDRLVIRLGKGKRPEKINAPVKEGEVLMKLKRASATTTTTLLDPVVESHKPTRKRLSNKQMLIFIDSLGSATILVENKREHLGRSLDDITRLLRKGISDNSVTLVEFRVAPRAPKRTLDTMIDVLSNTEVKGVNVTRSRQPLAPIQLDFRVAAMRASEDMPGGLSDEEVNRLIAVKKKPSLDEEAGAITSKYIWLEIDTDAYETVRQQADVITLELERPFLLVSALPESTMLATDEGKRAWRIVSAESLDDPNGRPAISVTLNEAGGKRLSELTANHLRRPLAVVLNNRAIVVPRIQTKIADRVQITGNLDKELVAELVKAFNDAAE